MNESSKINMIKSMYQKYPYPSSAVGDNLIYDLAGIVGVVFDEGKLSNCKILDVGCGAGHRLIGLASVFPDCSFFGLDMTDKSLETANQLAQFHNITNIKFINSKIEDFDAHEEYDVVVSTGVIHHMEDPKIGFETINKALKKNGLALIWLYHSVGEYYRLVDRELFQLLARYDTSQPFYLNTTLLDFLNMSLDKYQYGNVTTQHDDNAIQSLTLNVDAFLHPIVNGYRFQEIKSYLKDASFNDILCLGFNRAGESKLININNSDDKRDFLKFRDLYDNTQLNKLYKKLTYDEKVKALELSWKPTGITVVALKSESSNRFLNPFFKN